MPRPSQSRVCLVIAGYGLFPEISEPVTDKFTRPILSSEMTPCVWSCPVHTLLLQNCHFVRTRKSWQRLGQILWSCVLAHTSPFTSGPWIVSCQVLSSSSSSSSSSSEPFPWPRVLGGRRMIDPSLCFVFYISFVMAWEFCNLLNGRDKM